MSATRYRTVLLNVRVPPSPGAFSGHFDGRLLLRVWSDTDGEAMAIATRAIPQWFVVTDMSIDDLPSDKETA